MASVITGYATEQLATRVEDLVLGEGLQVSALGGLSGEVTWVRGDVSIGVRKGKHFPVYALELELPWSRASVETQLAGLIAPQHVHRVECQSIPGATSTWHDHAYHVWHHRWSGHGCSGLLLLPDVCLELLADVEVEVQTTEGTLPAAAAEVLQTAGVAAVRAAVQAWGHALARTVREDSTRAAVPLDPPSEAQAPRSAQA